MDDDFEATLPVISDERFAELRARATPFTLAVMRAGPAFGSPNLTDPTDPITAIIRAHAKRNMAMHEAGILPVVCPVADGTGFAGVSVFAATPERTREILDADPAIRASVLAYELHPTRTSTIATPPDGSEA